MDIGCGTKPRRNAASGVAHWHGAGEEPPIDVIIPPVAHLDLVVAPTGQRCGPLSNTTVPVIGMQHTVPVPGIFLWGEPAVVKPLVVGKRDGTIRVGSPDDRRDRVRQGTELCLARL